MSDPAIKLFGKTIPLQESKADSSSNGDHVPDAPPLPSSPSSSACCNNKDSQEGVNSDDLASACHEDGCNLATSSSCLPDLKEEETVKADANPDGKKVSEQSKSSTTSEEDRNEAEAAAGNEKVLKKPDKVLPCPRCNSLDTKFCYYNNYNVNQPRHFCKNCQRYWTAGGTMRNVPVGAGRRKNKHSASHYRHIMLPDGMATARLDATDATHNQGIPCNLPTTARGLKSNGTVLKFGSEAPLCESMANVLNLGEHAMAKWNAEMRSAACTDNREEVSCGSSAATPVSKENELQNMVNSEHGGNSSCCINPPAAPLLQCYAGTPWPYPWNPGWNGVSPVAAGHCSSKVVYGPENNNSSSVQWSPPPIIPGSAFCAPSIPFPFVPASYWGCMPGWAGRTWTMPWMGSAPGLSPSSSTNNSSCSGNNSPTLGKHSRDSSTHDEDKPERCVWVPKTLRIDDPDEAAKSSIWATLGIKHEAGDAVTKGGILKAFQPKMETKGHNRNASPVLHANPAALSRSQTFQEST